MEKGTCVSIVGGVLAWLSCGVVAGAPVSQPEMRQVRPEMRLSSPVTTGGPVRRTWTMAFVLAANPSEDPRAPDIKARVHKVNRMRDAVDHAFRVATGGLGAIEPSPCVYVVKTTPPPGGLSDEGEVQAFAQRVACRLYEETPDRWDFIAVYEAYRNVKVGSRHITARNDSTRSGLRAPDTTASFGSSGRLLGVGLIADTDDMPIASSSADMDMQLLLHETIAHQYGVFRTALDGGGWHFDAGIESPSFTVLYGRPWVRIDDTHFTTAEVRDPQTGKFLITFHPWILYAMGLKERNEVPARLMKVHPDRAPAHRYDLVTTTGTFEWITFTSAFETQ